MWNRTPSRPGHVSFLQKTQQNLFYEDKGEKDDYWSFLLVELFQWDPCRVSKDDGLFRMKVLVQEMLVTPDV